MFRSLSYSLLIGRGLGFVQLSEISSELLFGRNKAAEEAYIRDTLVTSYKTNQWWKGWFADVLKNLRE